ncbi:hypothetical protein P4110_11210 [Pseudomonas aeruginosa]|nr:hypothetical protein [Pseudomonas aeruginosa]
MLAGVLEAEFTPVTKLAVSPARMENQHDTEPWFAGKVDVAARQRCHAGEHGR